MGNIIYVVMGIIHVILLVLALQLFSRNHSPYTLISAAVIAGLAYDNLIIGFGTAIGEGTVLEILNVGRYVLHALATPLLIMFALHVARVVGLGWAQTRTAFIGFALLTGAMVLLGVYEDLISMNIVPVLEDGALRYSPVESSPPIPSIITVIVMIVVGLLVWWRARDIKWPWLCIGAVIMFVAAAAGAGILVVGNIGEVIFSASIVGTDYRINKYQEQNSVAETAPVVDAAPAG